MTTHMQGRYFGKGGPLFRLHFITSLLTLFTLGIYRFWAKTRIRKYVWSATTGDNDSFEYTGTGLEKFLGFLVAIVILAIYLGIVQVILAFIGLSVIPENDGQAAIAAQAVAINLSVLAVLPLMLFAQYRARRYKMARTRWRGIRFGMENGARGYAARAIGYYLLTLISLGMLMPLASFKLEKYMADRSWYGDAPFVQNGRWADLYGGMKHVFIGLALVIVSIVLLVSGEMELAGGILLFVGVVWIQVGFVFYRVFAFNYLSRNKILDGEVTFDARLETGTIIGKVIVGTIVIAVIMGVLLAVVAGISALLISDMTALTVSDAVLPIVMLVVLYVPAFIVAGGLSLVMITQPIIEHAVNNVTVFNTNHLDKIRQRTADKGADAEGFADALDVGGAI
jgi:uncharacterized membrane protein YjgN (DUF898 family)